MYYRRKVLLALLEEFGGKLSSTDFQKYLFLLTNYQQEKSYEFLPYKFGCFSFVSYADKRSLSRDGYLSDGEGWALKRRDLNHVSGLTPSDRGHLIRLKSEFGKRRGRTLLKHIYTEFPYYAIRSEIAHEVLDAAALRRVAAARPCLGNRVLATIGYEGMTLDGYLNKLIKNDIKVLCDVRKNPISRKYGFSKSHLRDALGKIGVEYVHIPELGIDSAKRKNLHSLEDYQRLFAEYDRKCIPLRKVELAMIVKMIKVKRRVALTCFEADACSCHRSRVSAAIAPASGLSFEKMDL